MAPPLLTRTRLSFDAAQRHMRDAMALLPRRDAEQVIDVPRMTSVLHDLVTAMLRTRLWLRDMERAQSAAPAVPVSPCPICGQSGGFHGGPCHGVSLIDNPPDGWRPVEEHRRPDGELGSVTYRDTDGRCHTVIRVVS